MAEYIEKNRLILSMNDWMLQNAPVKAGDDTTRADTILDAIKMVEDSPAADVRENVKGEWIYKSGERYKEYTVTCPFCGASYKDCYDGYINAEDFDFCPNCGAQMGGAEDGGAD